MKTETRSREIACYPKNSMKLAVKTVSGPRYWLINISGGDGVEETPVPIPNTEVKLHSVDGTALVEGVGE